jgi:hypothetical protein
MESTFWAVEIGKFVNGLDIPWIGIHHLSLKNKLKY